jgi:hypothetical protein
MSFVPGSIRSFLKSYSLFPFPEPPPSIVALCLLIGLVPALVYTWRAAGNALTRRLSGSLGANDFAAATFFIHAIVSVSRSTISLVLSFFIVLI